MKITSENAAVFSANAKGAVSFYEENFGFKLMHKIDLTDDLAPLTAMYCMENESGVHVDVIQYTGLSTDMSGFRVNVNNFEDAFTTFTMLGYTVDFGPAIIESATSAYISRNGADPILLMQHIQK